jgi:hypothetical protein
MPDFHVKNFADAILASQVKSPAVEYGAIKRIEWLEDHWEVELAIMLRPNFEHIHVTFVVGANKDG